MRAAVVTAVREFAKQGRTEFRASSVARRTGIPFDIARRDLVGMASSGMLDMKFAVLCPETGNTLETFPSGTPLPETYSSWECCEGEEFEVTPSLVWVVFSPSTALVTDLAVEATEAVSPPGKPTAPVSTEAGEDQLAAYVAGPNPPLVVTNNYGPVSYMSSIDDHSQTASGSATTGGVASSSGGSAGAGGSQVASDRAAVSTKGKASVRADVSPGPEKSATQPRPRAAIATGVVALLVLVVAIGLIVGGVVSLAIGLAIVAVTALALAAVAQVTRRT